MCFSLLASLLSLLLDLVIIRYQTEQAKDLELLLLRQQVRILHRKQTRQLRIAMWEKLALAVLVAKLRRLTTSSRPSLEHVLVLFKPETVLKWHRDLVRRKWTFKRRRVGGRPRIPADLETLLLRLARENPAWGYGKLEGELLKLGYTLAQSTIRDVLRRNKVPPAPTRSRSGSSWHTFLNHYKDQVVACDFFTVETLWLKTIYVLFFLELSTRRVHVAGCTSRPTAAWVTQQARQLGWKIQDGAVPARFLIHDRDAKFPATFDTVFAAEGVTVLRTPYRAPTANAFAERWIRSVREECLDQLVILNERHLQRVLNEYIVYFNGARPHQGLHQQCPVPARSVPDGGSIRRRNVLGGIIHDYYRE
ncbi:MAG TPA: integrase core domain-containing protein, partial [Herpetosiphonaceae bacterium]|nr:integrase core domain-containing protein [Herpetosiphonaceae bacterium]